MKNLIVRADASEKIGTGHIMRCLALAQAWQFQGGETIFVMIEQTSPLEKRLRSEGMQTIYLTTKKAGSREDAEQTAHIAQKFSSSWIIVDGYGFGFEYQKDLKSYKLNLLFIDDYGHAKHYCSDLVLNQNISANSDLYLSREPYTQLLLGTKYTLLRREFWQYQGFSRAIAPIANKILVTLGGSDPYNVTSKVIHALSNCKYSNLEVVVVIGASNFHYDQLDSLVNSLQLTISLKRNVTNMPELMAWADLAIAAGGSTNWELAFMALPSIVITIADNQNAIAYELDHQGVIVSLGWHQDLTIGQISLTLQDLISDRPRRETMSKKGLELVDGNGAMHIVSEMVGMLA